MMGGAIVVVRIAKGVVLCTVTVKLLLGVVAARGR